MECCEDCLNGVPTCLQEEVYRNRISGFLAQWLCSSVCVRFPISVNNKLSDDDDINRKIRNLFMHTNILVNILLVLNLFRAYCMCLYDVGLWRHQ